MKKEIVPVFLLAFILFTSIVSASSGSDDGTKTTEAAKKEAIRMGILDNFKARHMMGMRRFDKDISCDNLRSAVACERLHEIFVTCADKTGSERGSCLKGGVHPEKDKESKRDYLVVLLSDLQERVANANKNGRLTDEQAAELTAKIAEIKDSILNGDSRDTIKAELKELRDLWKTVKDSIKDSDSEDTSGDQASEDSSDSSGDDSDQDTEDVK